MRNIAGSVVLVTACCLSTACVRVIEHNQNAAASAAERFAATAFVKKDHAAAKGMLSPAGQESMDLEKVIQEMHPASFPASVKAIEYEPMPGQAAMQIYLKGTAEKEEFYYRFVMSGDRHSGYQVLGLWRGSGPYPPSTRKPL
jgi:hypothetical protein